MLSQIKSNVLRVASPRLRVWLWAMTVMALALSLSFGSALAAPVAPDKLTYSQPDGTVIVITPFGDEWYSGYEYAGYAILIDSASGYWVYAAQTKDGRLLPGTARVGIDLRPAGLLPHLRDRQLLQARPDGNSELSPSVWSGALGEQKVLVILTDFTPSASRGTSDAQWNQLFFSPDPADKSVRHYYQQASYNNFNLAPAAETYGTVNDGVIAVTLGYAHPDPDSMPGDIGRLIVKNALEAADAHISFSSLDTNANGALDVTELHLMIIVRGFEEAYGGTDGACSPSVWGSRSSFSTSTGVTAPVLDGVTVGATSYGGGYTMEGEWHEMIGNGCVGSPPGHMATMGIMVHELGHDIDWPDLYDVDNTSEGVGNWSLMASGSWGRSSWAEYSGVTPILPDPFLKWYQGWLTPIELTSPVLDAVSIPNAAENAVVYQIGLNPAGLDWDYRNAAGSGEYFLIENRQLTGYDAGLWSIDNAGAATGCMIWHIDETRPFDTPPNNTEARKLVDVEEADGPIQDLDFPGGSGGNRGDAGDPWPGNTGETTFGGVSDPNSNWYDGSSSGVMLTNISNAGTGCTLNFTSVGPMWDGSEGSAWDTANNWTVGRAPNQNDTTVIPAGVLNWPDLTVAASVGNLTIMDGAHLNVTAPVALEVYGRWNEIGSGYLDAGAGSVIFRSNNPQSITTRPGSHFNHLQIGTGSSTGTVTAGSDLTVNANLTIMTGASLAAGSHNISVAGNWNDAPLGFMPGSGTVTLNGTAQTVQKVGSERVVYTNDLSSSAGWLINDTNADGRPWFFSTSTAEPNSPNSGQHARYQYNPAAAANDWLFSPGFSLQAGVTYTIRFNYGARLAAYPERLKVHVGSQQNVAAMTISSPVFDNSNVINIAWQQGSGSFTPSASGIYYLGFHCYSTADKYNLAIDDITVAIPDPDLAFYNLSVAGAASLSDHTAVGNNLVIDAASSLALGTYNLTVENTLTNNGALLQTKAVNHAGISFLNIRNRAGSSDRYLGVTIDPGSNDMGSTTVTIWGNQTCPHVSEGVRRCFDINPATPQPGTISLYYTEAERNGLSAALLQVYHWNGSAWVKEPGAVTRGGSGDAQWVQVAGVLAYSPFGLANSDPTSVDLSEYSVGASESGVVSLAWQTASELDLLGFVIYRAESDNGPLEMLTHSMIACQMPGSITGGSYVYQDTTALPGRNYIYWIEALHANGPAIRFGPIRPADRFMLFLPMIRD